MKKQFQTPDLPYSYDALEPYIDKETMVLHHDKHHVAYTTKLNAALAKHPELFAKEAEDLLKNLDGVPEDIRSQVRNHGGGHVNHAFFWEIMGPQAGGQPHGQLLQEIEKNFGSFQSFQKNFEEAATTLFGSGWAWLVFDNGKLSVTKTSNQDSPLSEGFQPILALDVWEHAYYLKYRNVRADYVKAFWQVVNWKSVEEKFNAVTK